MESLSLAVGLGLCVSLLFTELFGLAAGGLVVPGYLAVTLERPLLVLGTLAAGIVTALLVRAIAALALVFGRRRTVLMLLVGYLVGATLPRLAPLVLSTGPELKVIGHVIPGLIGVWVDRQGLVETLGTLLTAAVVVRLLLILFGAVELAA
jgi:poly-gamma-glutamate biosynthesis protein PgsC/CapC